MMKSVSTGIILAGGLSTRMGREKGLVSLNGRPLIEYAISILKPITTHLLISSNYPGYDQFGFPVIKDIYRDIGPMGGIFSCLKESKTSVNFVLSCDMPFVRPELFNHLMKNSKKVWVTLPSGDGIHPEPMCGIYRKDILPEMERFIKAGNYKLPDLFKTINFKMIHITKELDFYSKHLYVNVNTAEDLRDAENLIG